MQLPVHQFNVPAPEAWQGAATEPLAPGSDWWAYLNDEGLDAAIQKALNCSQSLRAAAARIEVATQERLIVGSPIGRKSAWAPIACNSARTLSGCLSLAFPIEFSQARIRTRA